jgi:hypothetical protein
VELLNGKKNRKIVGISCGLKHALVWNGVYAVIWKNENENEKFKSIIFSLSSLLLKIIITEHNTKTKNTN